MTEKQNVDTSLLGFLAAVWSKKHLIIIISLTFALVGTVAEILRPGQLKVLVTLTPAKIHNTPAASVFNQSLTGLTSPSPILEAINLDETFRRENLKLRIGIRGINEGFFEDSFSIVLNDKERVKSIWNSVLVEDTEGDKYQFLHLTRLGSQQLMVIGPNGDIAERLARRLVNAISLEVSDKALEHLNSQLLKSGILLESHISFLKKTQEFYDSMITMRFEALMMGERNLDNFLKQRNGSNVAMTEYLTETMFFHRIEIIRKIGDLQLISSAIEKEIFRLESADIIQRYRMFLADLPLMEEQELSAVRIAQLSRQTSKAPFSMGLLASLVGLFLGLGLTVLGSIITSSAAGKR